MQISAEMQFVKTKNASLNQLKGLCDIALEDVSNVDGMNENNLVDVEDLIIQSRSKQNQ